MIRTRLIWFGVGFSVAGTAVSRLVWRDIGIDRYALFSDVKQKFDALEARVFNLEAVSYPKSSSGQAEG
ncbi:uncharacterized protein LOC133880384 [Alnus glutinosa]|uniref:uncharacterized protein LOC133880384 n=1 Tax=Alnus glutinosa TaxID=3517 RepID=UPI002D77FA0A|nr:uncharacterized protein LOC133880384 [Alnus glutinosa]